MALFQLWRPRRFYYEPRHETSPAARPQAPGKAQIRLRILPPRPPASSQNHARWLLLILIVAGLWCGALLHAQKAKAVRWGNLRVEEVR